MIRRPRLMQWTAIGALMALSACKIDIGSNSDNGGNDPLCRPIGGGSSTVQATPSAGGTVSDIPRAFDGDLSSFASYAPAAGSGTLTLRGTAQSGIVRPAREEAGILFTRFADTQNFQVAISTFLGGTMQDTGTVCTRAGASDVCSPQLRNGMQYFGLNTSKPFDAIEVTLTVSGLPATFQARELCVR